MIDVEYQKYSASVDKRDKAAEDASKEFEGGSGVPLVYNSVLGEKTKEKCYQLVDGYMK